MQRDLEELQNKDDQNANAQGLSGNTGTEATAGVLGFSRGG